jgi:hypothetical protein
MPDFGIFRGFNEKLFGDKLYAGQLPINLGLIGSEDISLLLLDFYPNAAAAYSLRKLRSAYTGSAIRVRRTDFQESDIGFTGLGNLDTAALLAFTGTGALDNGFVTTWYDQSGNGYNATQTTAANQPQIVSSGSVITDNGKPTLQFDGIDDNLDANSLASVFSGNNSFFSTSSVFKCTNILSGSEQSVFGFGSSTTNTPTIFIGPTSRIPFTNVTTSSIRSDSNIENRNFGTSSANQVLCFTDKSFNNSNLFTNGVLNQSATATIGNVTLNLFAIGTLSRVTKVIYFNGLTQEIVIYNSDESSNRTGIETNINDFYSIY